MPDGRERLDGLVQPALAVLERSVNPSGLLCYELVEGERRGESVRYSLIVLLGLLRARSRALELPFQPDALRRAIDASLDRPEVGPGDIGLALWAEARGETGATTGLMRRLHAMLEADGGPAALEGLHLAWIIIGLALAAERDAPGAEALLRPALDQLLGPNQAESGLFRHFGARGFRRRFPNFATEIYAVLALTLARGADQRALVAGRRAADVLLRLQLADGGWPWLFDADSGRVVERYEVYSVHQHGMAPMALMALAEAAGEPRYADAARAGLPWLFGENELHANMLELERGVSRRSIRRRRPLDRLCLYANTAAALAGAAPMRRSGRALELNRSCRPYELGWLVESWA